MYSAKDMNTIAPVRQLPLYWVATSLLGFTPAQLARALEVNPSTVRRWAFGHNPSPTELERLRTLVTRTAESPQYNVCSYRDLKSRIARQWVRLTFRLINEHVLQATPPKQRPRLGKLQRAILNMLPAPRNYVITQLITQGHKRRAIMRAATDLGVLEERVLGTPHWKHPGREIVVPPAPATAPTIVPPSTPRAEQLRTALSIYLGRAHDRGRASVPYAELLAVATSHGHSKPSFHRALKDMCLLRECTGFGANKSSRYALPHLKDQPQ